jgi:protein-disulfide isomerase
MRPRALVASVASLLAACVLAAQAMAAELVMFEDPACPWCRRWHQEIGPAYPATAEGKRAPLRRVIIEDQENVGVVLERPVTATPTFVLAEDGRELGRIVGYPGEDFFYGLLGKLQEARLPVRR